MINPNKFPHKNGSKIAVLSVLETSGRDVDSRGIFLWVFGLARDLVREVPLT